MTKRNYLIQTFLYVLLSIFFLMLTETQVFDIIYKYSLYKEFTIFIVINLLILVFWILSIVSFFKFSQILHKEKLSHQADLLQQDESKKLIQTLQSQRHDYRNQLQVIRVLAQFNKIQELIKYLDDYISFADNSASLSTRINNSVISALFLVYQTEAKDKGIKLSVDSDIDFSNFPYSPAKITRILGNIIRNAIEILDEKNLPMQEIQVAMWETAEHYVMTIWNNGPVIPKENMDKIFLPGFSTKNSSGLGLSIVKQLVDEFEGWIEVQSGLETGTEFKITLPSKKSVAI